MENMLPVAHSFTQIITTELSAVGQYDQFGTILGSDVAAVSKLEDPKQLGALVKRWNVYAGTHPPLARLAFYERGVASEVALGHRGLGKVFP